MTRIPCAGTALACVVTLVAGLGPALAADQVPNLKGKWAGKTHTIVAGVAPHWPSNRGTFDKPGLFEKDLVIEVTNQEGRRFWGKQTFSGGGEQTSEPMIGEPARTTRLSSSSIPTAFSMASSSTTTP